jgi:hypothetical protein
MASMRIRREKSDTSRDGSTSHFTERGNRRGSKVRTAFSTRPAMVRASSGALHENVESSGMP